MRWYILKTLLYKEALRHATNRGGLMLAALLVTASLVLAVMNPVGDQSSPLMGGIHHCFIHVDDENSAWVQHLQQNVPASLKKHILFETMDSTLGPDRVITYPTGPGAIQIRTSPADSGSVPHYLVWVWHPSADRAGMAVYERWFWRETYRFFRNQAAEELTKIGVNVDRDFPMSDIDKDDLWDKRIVYEQLRRLYAGSGSSRHLPPLPDVEFKESALAGSSLDMRAAIATALVMFALFFTCVYLMPSLTCEERERGLLLAQVLSPARTREILAAKFLFYPAFGIFLATLLAGIHNPDALARPIFWLSLLSLALGSLGIGMTISSLARTQRSASLAALCYMLVVALMLLICQQNNITWLPYLAIEYHAPQILHASLTNQLRTAHWFNLLGCGILAIGWVFAAGSLFRRRGWQ
jgi:hypothetical protein